MQNISYFNRETLFVVTKRINYFEDFNYYWIANIDSKTKVIKTRILRKELFTISDNHVFSNLYF